MEDVLALYAEEYDPLRPVICFDEKPYQLLGHIKEPIPPKPGQPRREDYEYKRNGHCNLLLIFEPKTGRRFVKVTERRTKKDFAALMQEIAAEFFPEATELRLVCDNLNTHNPSSFYETFDSSEARRLTELFDFHYTPNHASWLNMCEIEFSVIERQCLKRRLATIEEVRKEVQLWQKRRNGKKAMIDWRFDIPKARQKFAKRYANELV